MSDADPGAGEGAGKLGDDAQAVLSAARGAAGAYVGTLQSLQRLFLAELGLAREALVQATALLILATVMVATTWVLATALMVAAVRATGASWALSIAVPLLLSIAIGVLAAWRAKTLLRHLDFEATRRQVKLGLKGLPSEPPRNDDEAAP